METVQDLFFLGGKDARMSEVWMNGCTWIMLLACCTAGCVPAMKILRGAPSLTFWLMLTCSGTQPQTGVTGELSKY